MMRALRRLQVVTLIATSFLVIPAGGQTLGQWVQDAKLLAGDGSIGDSFGSSIDVDGHFIVVGARDDNVFGRDSGSAYVFRYEADSLFPVWRQEAKLIPPEGKELDFFGITVAIDDDTVAVGAKNDDQLGRDRGAVYIYRRQANGTWPLETVLFGTPQPTRQFGRAVAIRGEWLAVGGSDQVYVFRRRANGEWIQDTLLVAGHGQFSDGFGLSIAISGSRIVIGAPFGDGIEPDAGSAYVFRRSANGEWIEEGRLVGPDVTRSQSFGWSVDIDGDAIIVGASHHGHNGTSSGAAFVFRRDQAGQWLYEAELLPSDADEPDYFGWSVAIRGDMVVCGSLSDDTTEIRGGSAYVYQRDADSVWREKMKLVPRDPVFSGGFGSSAAIDGHRLVIGASGADGLVGDTGAAYVFEGFDFTLHPPDPGIAGVVNTVAAEGVAPGTEVTFIYSLAGEGFTAVPGCGALGVQLRQPIVIDSAIADENGIAWVRRFIPENARGRTVYLQSAVGSPDCLRSPVIQHVFQ